MDQPAKTTTIPRENWRAWGRQWNTSKHSYWGAAYRDLTESDVSVHDLQTPKSLPPMLDQPHPPLPQPEFPDAPWVESAPPTQAYITPISMAAQVLRDEGLKIFDCTFDSPWRPILQEINVLQQNPILQRIDSIMQEPERAWTYATPIALARWLRDNEVEGMRLIDGEMVLIASGKGCYAFEGHDAADARQRTARRP
jgi:hypothetical protein